MFSSKFCSPKYFYLSINPKLFFAVLFWGFSSLSFADMPDFYSEPGLGSNRDNNNQNNYETVDPFSGKLKLHNTDIFIPGNGGFDLKVERTYTSGVGNTVIASPNLVNKWALHYGYVFRPSAINICARGNVSNKSNPVLVLPDGSNHVLSDSASGGFISDKHWKASCMTGGLRVTSPEGTEYEMTYQGGVPNLLNSDIAYYARKITDKNGNSMTITYSNPISGVQVTSVTTSDGRSLSFSYTKHTFRNASQVLVPNGFETLSSISFNGLVWNYTYTVVPGFHSANLENQTQHVLTRVTRPGGLTWEYGYNRTSAPGNWQINYVKEPRGTTINYTYGTKIFYSGLTSLPDNVINSKAISGLGTWTYSYTPSTSLGSLDTTTVGEPGRTITYRHFGYATVGGVSFQGELWKVGLLAQKSISGQTETYNWTPLTVSSQNAARNIPGGTAFETGFKAPLLSSKTISRDGATFTTNYSNYDSYGNPGTISESGSASRTITRTYNVNTTKWVLHNLASENIGGFITSYGYNVNGNLTSENKYGVITTYGRSTSGDIISITDARSKVKTLSNYARGVPLAELHPNGATVSRTVSTTGNVLTETDGVGVTVGYSYDSSNRPVLIDRPLGNDVIIGWGAFTRQVDRGNFRENTTFDYNYNPRTITRTDLTTGATITTTMQYDAIGRKTFESLPGSTTGTTYTYDALDRVITVTFANGTTNSYVYSGSNVIFTNEKGLVYTYGYRTYGNPDNKELLSVVAPVTTANMTITRNAIGQPLTIVQNGITRTYGYNANAFLTSEINPETGTTTYGRDAVGNMTTRTVGTSGVTTYTYDNMNRVSAITYPVPATTPGVGITYDLVGQVVNSVVGPVTRVSTYDANRNLTSETQTIDGRYYQALYRYNANDALSGITYPSGQTVTYTLDAFGRQTSALPYASAVSYHPSSQPSSITLANGVVTNYGYQARHWPSAMSITKGTTPLINSSYTYDNNGNVTNIGDTVVAQHQRTLSYDNIDRLIGADGPWGTGTIAYNGQGNITSQAYGTFSLAHNYDAQNRLSSVVGGRAFTFSYDAYGNVTNNGTTTFQYDDGSNMRCSNCALSTSVRYDYNANNLRSKKLVGTTATYYFYGLNGSLLGEYTPATQLQKEYFYLGAKLLAEREVNALLTPNISYYHADVLGSPLAVSDALGAISWRENYRPYGSRTFNQANTTGKTLWFAGKPQDADSGLSYFGARYYDPTLGRFMGIDPVGVDPNNIHSHNRYAYANNNPYKFVDPTGNIAETALDVISLGLSIQQYRQEPGILNGIGVAYDAVATIVPVLPGGFGIVRNVARGAEAGVDVAQAAATAKTASAASGAKALKTELHHSDPKFLGGAKNQDLTELDQATHKALHKDMNDFLKTKVNDKGQHMRPQRGNSGKQIQDNFGRDQCVAALCEFYRGPGAKYEGAAKDFFKQHPGE